MLYCQPMENEMATWLNEKLNEKNWSMRELARRIGKSHTAIADIAKGEMNPSPEMCRLIAEVFSVAPETVFRHAGLLPNDPDDEPDVEEGRHLLRRLPPEKRRDFIIQMRAIVEVAETKDRIPEATGSPGRRGESE